MGFQRLLIAVDDNPIAAHAADVGLELARALHAEVALIHTIDSSPIFAPESGREANELELRAEQDGKRLMADFRAKLPEETHVLQFISQGLAGDEIVKAARQWEADMIVIGSHGRHGLTRALLGSVAEAVMRHSPCPVLVVRAKA